MESETGGLSASSERGAGSPAEVTTAVFINVEVADDIAGDAEMAQKLEDACPVDIYANRDGKVEVVEENLDECILCGLCVDAAPPGKVRVVKLYDGTALER